MRASDFHDKYGRDANYWGEDAAYPLSDWQAEVEHDGTRLGYWDWVAAQREAEQDT